MLEFFFGWILGVWMGQQLPLPSVQNQMEQWWNRRQSEPAVEASSSDETIAPVFTGDMPSSV